MAELYSQYRKVGDSVWLETNKSTLSSINGEQEFSFNISNLIYGTVYEYRAAVDWGSGPSYGSIAQFTTPTPVFVTGISQSTNSTTLSLTSISRPTGISQSTNSTTLALTSISRPTGISQSTNSTTLALTSISRPTGISQSTNSTTLALTSISIPTGMSDSSSSTILELISILDSLSSLSITDSISDIILNTQISLSMESQSEASSTYDMFFVPKLDILTETFTDTISYIISESYPICESNVETRSSIEFNTLIDLSLTCPSYTFLNLQFEAGDEIVSKLYYNGINFEDEYFADAARSILNNDIDSINGRLKLTSMSSFIYQINLSNISTLSSIIDLIIGESDTITDTIDLSVESEKFPSCSYEGGDFAFLDYTGKELPFAIISVSGISPNKIARVYIDIENSNTKYIVIRGFGGLNSQNRSRGEGLYDWTNPQRPTVSIL